MSDLYLYRVKAFVENHPRSIDIILFSIGFAIVVLLRYDIVFSFPFPSGSDGAGDIIISNSIMRNGLTYPDTIPPFYYLAVMIPSLLFFSPEVSIKILIVVIPAMLTVPSYLILKQASCNRPISFLGSLILANSAAFSLMVTWNSAYNVFGIFLMLFYMFFLLKFLLNPNRKNIILSAAFFALVAATHELTFLISVVTTIFTLATHVSLNRTKASVKDVAKFLATVLVFTSILIPVYIYNLLTLSNLSGTAVASRAMALENLVLQGFFFSWGYQGGVYVGYSNAFYLVLLSLTSLLFLILDQKRRYLAFTFIGIMVGSFYFSEINPSNYTRGYYFLAIPLILSTFVFVQMIYERIPALSSIFEKLEKKKTSIVRPVKILVSIFIVSTLLFVIITESEVSSQTLLQGEKYYQALNTPGYEASIWMKNNLPQNATFFSDSLGLWPGAISGLNELPPSILGAKVTQSSYRIALETDLLYLGDYLIKNNNFVVVFDGPNFSYPFLDVYQNGFWYPLLLYEAAQTTLFFSNSFGQKESLNLSDSSISSLSESVSSSNVAYINSTYLWNNSGLKAFQSIEEQGGVVSVHWSSQNNTLLGVHSVFYFPSVASVSKIPLTNPEYNYTSYLHGNRLFLSLEVSNGNINNSEFRGSTYITMNSTSFDFSIYGDYLASPGTPQTFNTVNIAKSLGITYFLVNKSSDPQMYYRLLYLEPMSGGVANEIYDNGFYQIFVIKYLT